jgi:hypothetical protein
LLGAFGGGGVGQCGGVVHGTPLKMHMECMY